MSKKFFRFSTVAIFLGILLITMLLSRAEERRKATAAANQGEHTAITERQKQSKQQGGIPKLG
ncbi:MAG: hypothetical protein IJN07_06780 [Clostridia bacterium]|nr:hypothetical protein [Clostridia bacterium]